MRTNDEIIQILTQLKDDKGLSLSELARRVGMAKSGLSRYFNKTREFPLNRVNEFANALGVSPEYILGFDESSETSTIIEKTVNVMEKLSKSNQRDVYDYAEMKLNKQDPTKVVKLPNIISDVEMGEDPTIVRAAHLDMDGITDEEKEEVNEFYKFADEYARKRQRNKE